MLPQNGGMFTGVHVYFVHRQLFEEPHLDMQVHEMEQCFYVKMSGRFFHVQLWYWYFFINMYFTWI